MERKRRAGRWKLERVIIGPSGSRTLASEVSVNSQGLTVPLSLKTYTIGGYTIVNLDCTIGHEVDIGKYTTISPGVHISGKVFIGDECFIGTGAVIIDRVTMGMGSYIGAGAVVREDIPENVLALGVPAKPIRRLSESDWRELI